VLSPDHVQSILCENKNMEIRLLAGEYDGLKSNVNFGGVVMTVCVNGIDKINLNEDWTYIILVDYGEIKIDNEYTVPQLEYALIIGGQNKTELQVEGKALLMIVAGPPKTDPISFKPGFGGIMFGNSVEELESVSAR